MTVFGLQWTMAASPVGVRPTCAATAGGATQNALSDIAVTSPTNAHTTNAVAQASANAPWSGMRRCNVWEDGTPTAYYGDRCYTDTDVANMGQCMVQIPKFLYATDHTAGVYRWFISNTGTETVRNSVDGANLTWNVHPAFIRAGATKNSIYLGAYEGYINDTKLESKAGVAPTATTLTASRTAAHARVGGVVNKWEQQDYLSTAAVQLLYLVEYGNFNSQILIGGGLVDQTLANTGATGSTGINRGNATYGVAGDYTYAMSYRGIENLYGNIWHGLDGVKYDDSSPNHIWVADNSFNDSATYTSPYTDLGVAVYHEASGFISDIIATSSSTNDYSFAPLAGGGSETTGLCDALFSYSGSNPNILGIWGSLYTVTPGIFGVVILGPSGTMGSRLIYMG